MIIKRAISWKGLVYVGLLAIGLGVGPVLAEMKDQEVLTVVVMDPLSGPLSCPCVEGYAQKDYEVLGEFLAKKLGRSVQVFHGESIARAREGREFERIDILIGKDSQAKAEAAKNKLQMVPVASLTDQDGKTTMTGLLVVRSEDKAQSLADLKGYQLVAGPEDEEEKHDAVLAALGDAQVELAGDLKISPSCADGAVKASESERTVAAISSYAKPLLLGCGVIDQGVIRPVGETKPVPFITVFLNGELSVADVGRIQKALKEANEEDEILKSLESKKGFVPYTANKKPTPRLSSLQEWTGWRGAHRDGVVPSLPQKLSAKPKVLWKASLNGECLAGIAATRDRVLIADRDDDGQRDVFFCLDAKTGAEQWRFSYEAPGSLDYGTSPRATPQIYGDRVFVLGAMGHLHCLRLSDGEVLWKCHLRDDFLADIPTWGFCSSPLLVEDKLIINPGADEASVVALDVHTGKVVWQTPGAPVGYGSFILATVGEEQHIVGFNEEALCGWHPETGKELWRIPPKYPGDFNVPTPIVSRDGVIVATESNGCRRYPIKAGSTQPDAGSVEVNGDLQPDMTSPVLLGGQIVGWSGDLLGLDAAGGLETLWRLEDDAFDDYVSLIAGSGRVLVATSRGEVLLVAPGPREAKVVSRWRIGSGDEESYAHPAVVGNRLYLRGRRTILCIDLSA